MDTTIRSESAWRSLLRPLITTRGWTAVTHHLLGLPLGIAYFVWLITGLSVGLGLAITDSWFAKLKAYWTDGPTWRGVLYLLARFPVGTFTFTVAVSTYASALFLVAAPILAPIDPMELGIWEPDTWYEGMALVPLGLLLLVISGWISEAMAAMSRGFARWGTRDTPAYL
jgi:hypothetical protein